jgi:hypothetical protein
MEPKTDALLVGTGALIGVTFLSIYVIGILWRRVILSHIDIIVLLMTCYMYLLLGGAWHLCAAQWDRLYRHHRAGATPARDDAIRCLDVARVTLHAPSPTDDDAARDDLPNGQCCRVCLEREKRVVCVPCGHLYLCLSCARAANTPMSCAVCRTNVFCLSRVYQ